MVMNVPALAADPPDGATQTMVGRFCVQGLRDALHCLKAAAEGVELDDDSGGTVGFRPVDRPGDVIRHDVVHHAARWNDDYLGAIGRGGGQACGPGRRHRLDQISGAAADAGVDQ